MTAASHDENAPTGLTPHAVAQLVQGHERFLTFLQRRVSSRAIAEDILQEAFARALERGDSLRDGESAVAWFYRLLRNAIVDHYRRTASAGRALEAAAQELAQDSAVDGELLDTVCKCVGDLVGTLKPEYADAIRSVDLEEQSVGSYAAGAGITPNNAGVRLHRAREALMRSLVRCCGTCATHGCVDCTCKS